MIFGRNIRKVRSLYNTYMNTTTPIIAMLDHSEIDIEISGIDIETTESNDCREMSGGNRNANGMLATMQERARFSCKDE